MASEPARKGGLAKILIACLTEQGAIITGTVTSGEEGVAGGPASGGMDVVASEGASGGGEFVEVRRMNVVGAKALQLGPKVVDAKKKHVRLRRGAKREEARGETEKSEADHGNETMGRGEGGIRGEV